MIYSIIFYATAFVAGAHAQGPQPCNCGSYPDRLSSVDPSVTNPHVRYILSSNPDRDLSYIGRGEARCDAACFSDASRYRVELTGAAISNYMFSIYCPDGASGSLAYNGNITITNTEALVSCGPGQRSYVSAPADCASFPVTPQIYCTPETQTSTGAPGTEATRFCVCNACGNGVLDSGEACDDGNTVSGDGCSALCVVEVVDSA